MFLLALVLCVATSFAETMPGLARPELYASALAGKRVALVVNQASLYHGEHAIELLRRERVGLVKLFALEHGVRGEGGAGEHIPDGVDGPSGLPIVSLYGDRRKPDGAALTGVDAIVFDVQDVGVRFFTYISSLGLILEAAAEHGIPVFVFDRPNPNDYVAGPVLDPALKSFVGAYPIPLVYGLTIGELARMIVGEGWQHTPGMKLTVVPLKGYDRTVLFAPEGRPSPGLRTLQAIRAYPFLGLFEPTSVSVGRGTDHPYEIFGAPAPFPGEFRFTPRAGGGGEPPLYQDQECRGTEFFARSPELVPEFTTDFFTNALRAAPRGFVRDRRFPELLVGDLEVMEQMLAGKSWAEISAKIEPQVLAYKAKRSRYLLYP